MNSRMCVLFSIVDFAKSAELEEVYASAKAPISIATHGFGQFKNADNRVCFRFAGRYTDQNQLT